MSIPQPLHHASTYITQLNSHSTLQCLTDSIPLIKNSTTPNRRPIILATERRNGSSSVAAVDRHRGKVERPHEKEATSSHLRDSISSSSWRNRAPDRPPYLPRHPPGRSAGDSCRSGTGVSRVKNQRRAGNRKRRGERHRKFHRGRNPNLVKKYLGLCSEWS